MNDLSPRPASAAATPAAQGYTRRYAIFGALFGLAFPLAATAASLAVARLPWTLTNILTVHSTQPLMWIIDTAPLFLGIFAGLAGMRQDAIEAGNRLLMQRARDLTAMQLTLEQRVAERTQELEQRNRQMRSAVQTTRKMAQTHDPAELASSSVRLIAQGFNDFFVDLYMLDVRRSDAVLTASSADDQASTGAAGARVKVGDPSLIGQVAASGEAGRVQSGVSGPELALPLLARGRPLGVLHFRAMDPAAALPADTEMLQFIADQLASALDTARLVGESRDALELLQVVSGQAVQTSWKEQASQPVMAFQYTPAGIKAAPPGSNPPDPRSLRVPLELRGQRIGSIALTRRGAHGWTEADRDLAEKTAAQVALALENVRLLEETRDRAHQEQQLSEFSRRLAQSVDLDTLLQTAVRELATLPEVADASIYVNPLAASAENEPS
ncbi:MAG: GAF domain-containing protein [Chloroflexota bacterium]